MLKRKSLVIVFLVSCLTGTLLLDIRITEADVYDSTCQIYMDPSLYEFTAPPLKAGTIFTVDVYSYNISALCVFQIVLVYNNTLLNCTNAYPDGSWDDPEWVFNKYYSGYTYAYPWLHYESTPLTGYNAEVVSASTALIDINLIGIETLMARFELEILLDPPDGEEFTCALKIADNSWMSGTFIQSLSEVSGMQKRYPLITDSYYNIEQFVSPDIDDDGFISMADVSFVAMKFGLSSEDEGWDSRADMDDDDWITMADVSYVASHFGEYW